MARNVFFSFKYKDVSRSMVVRNSWVAQGKKAAGFIDAADFEAIKKKGDTAIENWIDGQLEGTSVTVVLVGAKTCNSRWVKYEIKQSIARGNGLLGIDISKIKTELAWQPSLDFSEGLEKTVDWYLENEEWLNNVISGEYRKYYKDQYDQKS